MTYPFGKSIDPGDDLRREIAEIRRIAEAASTRMIRIPLLSQDPPTTDPTNIWMFPDGRLRARHLDPTGVTWIIREWVPTAPGSSTSAAALPPLSASPISRTKQYPAIWSQSYKEAGAARTDDGTTMLYYGSNGDINGQNRSLIGFDHATIAADLAGSTIRAVWLRILNVKQQLGGGHPYFGIHNFSTEPATWAGGVIPRSRIVDFHFTGTEERLLPLPIEFAARIRDGTGKGVAVEAPNGSSPEFYGALAGYGSPFNAPILVVEYVK